MGDVDVHVDVHDLYVKIFNGFRMEKTLLPLLFLKFLLLDYASASKYTTSALLTDLPHFIIFLVCSYS